MQTPIRNTGKFKPFQYIINHNFTTGSVIKVPQNSSTTSKLKSIQWRRKYEDLQEKLHHLDGVPEYACTELDKDFLIEAIIEYQLPNASTENRINIYGPISIQPQYNFLTDSPYPESQTFEIDIINHKKIYSCVLFFMPGQITIRNRTIKTGNQYNIQIADILNCFVGRNQNASGNGNWNGEYDMVTFPTLYSRILVLKLFNEILSKGSYSDNNDPTVLKIHDPNEQNPKIRYNLKWKRLLLRLNHIKQQNSRRMSMPVIQTSSTTSYKTFPIQKIQPRQQHQQSQPVFIEPMTKPDLEFPKKGAEHVRYSQDNATTEKKNQEAPVTMKKSQNNYQRGNTQSKNDKKNEIFDNDPIDNDNPYLTQFQNLINDEQQPERQVIELNDSFEQFQKKSRSQKQLNKLKQIKQRKKQRQEHMAKKRQLQSTLESLYEKRDSLIDTNNKLKSQIEAEKGQNYGQQIGMAKIQLTEARRELERLVEDANRRFQEQRKGVVRM